MINSKYTARGNRLTTVDKKHVLAAYVYRHTFENQRANPRAVVQAGSTLPLITDAEWLAVTEFAVCKSGHLLHNVRECYTHHSEIPAWKEVLDKWNQQAPALSVPTYTYGDGTFCVYIYKNGKHFLKSVETTPEARAAITALVGTLNQLAAK